MLNKEQQEVVDSTANKILVLAGAGTGKTHCMLARIKKLVNEGVDPTSILVLTFTNAAAYNMNFRYNSDSVGKFKKISPEFKTFHAFCYSLIANDVEVRSELGYSKVPGILSESEYASLRKTVKTKYHIKLSDAKLNGVGALDKLEQFQFDLFKNCIKRELLYTNKITFDMLCYDVCELFVKRHASILKYFDRYKYIFVDEFQDTDLKQWKFVQSFDDSKLYVVGDALQSLYSFRGADSSIIKSLATNEDWTTYQLHRNYRSTKQICDFANENSTYADDSYRVAIDSDKEGDSVNIVDVDFCGSQKMFRSIEERCKQLDSDKTLAVLCRTNAEVEEVREYLSDSGFQLSDDSGDLKWKRKLLSISEDDYEFLNFLSSNLTNEDYAEYIRISSVHSTGEFDIQNFLKFFQNKGMSQSIKMMNSIHEITWNVDYDYLIMYDKLLDLFNIKYIPIDFSEINSISDLITSICNVIDNIKTESNIYVGTIHSSKGLEYDEVHLVNVGGKTFRLTSEDNNNVYYVGITRAKTDLYVYVCR